MNNPQVKFIPAKHVVPWDRTNRNLPTGDGLAEWIAFNYFDSLDNLKEQFESVEPQTPRGNGFDFSITVDVSKQELWKDLDWQSINYVASTLKVKKDQKGYSYFHITNMTPRYYDDGHVVVAYDLELDEWCTFYDEITAGFHGKFNEVQGHKHEWKKVNDGFIPDFDNNQGISTCDEVCEQLNDKSVISDVQDLDSPNYDFVVLLFSSSRGDWMKPVKWNTKKSTVKDTIYSSASYETAMLYTGWDKSDTVFVFDEDNGDSYTIPYYPIFIPLDMATPKLITGIIDMLGITPANSDGAMGLYSILNDNKKISSNWPDINGTAWKSLAGYLQLPDESDQRYMKFSPTLSLGANLEIQQVGLISLPHDIYDDKYKNNYEKQQILIPTDINLGISSGNKLNMISSDKAQTNIIVPEFTTVSTITPKRASIDFSQYNSRVLGLEWNDHDGWITNASSGTIYGNRVIMNPYEHTIKKDVYQKDDIINNKISPHLMTINHYSEHILGLNQEEKEFDLKDYFYQAQNNFSIQLKGYMLINADRFGWKYYIKPSWMKKDVNAFNKKYIVDTVGQNILPYSKNQYNDFMRNNINSLQTGRENARATFNTQKQNAERSEKTQIGSAIFGGIMGMASGGWTTAGSHEVYSEAEIGSLAELGGAVGTGSGILSAVSSAGKMGFGIANAVNQKKNAINTARTQEQNTLRSINAKTSDARNSQVNETNINSGNTLSTILDEIELDKKYGINSIVMYESTIPDNQKDVIWYMRNTYGDGFVKTWEVKSLDELLTRHFFTTLRLTNIEPIINKMNVPVSTKEVLIDTFKNVVSLWDIGHLTKDSIMDYTVNNYDNILDDNSLRKYQFTFKLDTGKLIDTTGKEKI